MWHLTSVTRDADGWKITTLEEIREFDELLAACYTLMLNSSRKEVMIDFPV